jgi:hypothetical protein
VTTNVGSIASVLSPCIDSAVVLQSYQELLVKFPSSSSLHLDYAQFCEVRTQNIKISGYPMKILIISSPQILSINHAPLLAGYPE